MTRINVNNKAWSTLQVLLLLFSYTLVLTFLLHHRAAGLDKLSQVSQSPLVSNILGTGGKQPEAETSKGKTDLVATKEQAKTGGNKDVVVYVYSENAWSARNLEFFIAHALHDRVDFVFIINGFNVSVEIPDRPNIQVIAKENTCYDLGSYSMVLEADDNKLLNRYDRFILMNASIRGPFFPAWARSLGNACWTSLFFSYLTERNKLVGLTANCDENWAHRHIQSMLVAVDRIGYDLIRPSLQCWPNLMDAVFGGEIPMTNRVIEAGFDADVIYNARYSRTFESAAEYFSSCPGGGGNWEPYAYHGMDVNPLDTLFVKSIRTRWSDMEKANVYGDPGQHIFETFTDWMDASNFSSYEQC